jgi:photosystem II stability/assembly factor-like uncharacterized protein
MTEGGSVALASETRFWLDGVEHELPTTPMFLGHAGDRLLLGHDGGVSWSDDGATWTLAPEGMTDPGMSVVEAHPVCADRLVVASECSGGVYASGDHGNTWTHADAYFHYVMDVQFDPSDPARLWGISDDSLLRSDDEGVTWTEVWRQYHFHGFAVHPDRSEEILIGSVGSGVWADSSARVYRSVDDGETWTDSSTGIPTTRASAHVLHYVDDTTVLLGTYGGEDPSHNAGTGIGLFRSADGGSTWSLTSLPEMNVAGLADGPGGVWAATGTGLYVSADGGVGWTAAGPSEEWFLSVVFHGDVGLAYTTAGTAWRTADGGESWTPSQYELPPPGDAWLAQVSINADATVGYVTVPGWGMYRIGL